MLTVEQVEQYRETGYLLVSGIFTDAEVTEMESEFDGIIRRRTEARQHIETTWAGEWKKSMGEMQLLHTHDVQAYSASWARMLLHDRLTEAMADLIGPNVQLHHTKAFQKPPEKGAAFPMHQDHPYFPHRDHSMTAAVIHLTDAEEERGCLRVVPGSHKLGPLPIHKENHTGPQNLYLDPAVYPIDEATICPARRGDVFFFNYLTIHGSGINRSDKTRKTVLIQFRDPADVEIEGRHHHSNAQCMMLRGTNPRGNWREALAKEPTP